ncbi:hypothetical protein CLV92_1254 [Kineococcus xinjiangensis]|uniref:Uncharacterized protein n=1 Tax=Kineococcus xinjiangensis TaxID=512762 RepID=A0A2S6IBY3_9ACTN|nr:hypothetical protein [Kineococcus xinjiangensis]PPK90208.1 hypothetical protein CLV92_1254 [Kineococcus xinjiangensis]
MAGQFPPMSATITRTADTVTVTVEHAPRQSYSRAVQPLAMRAAATVGLALTLTGVNHDVTPPAEWERTGRCRSAYIFAVRPSVRPSVRPPTPVQSSTRGPRA